MNENCQSKSHEIACSTMPGNYLKNRFPKPASMNIIESLCSRKTFRFTGK